MDEISEILALVETRVGLNFEGTRLTTARSTVLEHAIDYASLAEFRAALLRTPLCWQTLIDRLVVNETFFFRHPEQLAIAADAVGERAQRGEDTRIASIGCSSGEEPYSLAILLKERELLDGATLTGFDVSATMLRRAAEGRYSPWALRTTSVSRRASYFSEHSDRSFELDPSIREQVRFRHLNLLEPTDTEPFDILLCCNILYYFRDSALTKAVEALKQLTRPSGLLIVGPSEPVLTKLSGFEIDSNEGPLVYRPAEEKKHATPGGMAETRSARESENDVPRVEEGGRREQSAQDITRHAMAAIDQDDFQRALFLAQRALSLRAGTLMAELALAMALAGLGRNQQADGLFHALLYRLQSAVDPHRPREEFDGETPARLASLVSLWLERLSG